MKPTLLLQRFRELLAEEVPHPGRGNTEERFNRLWQIGLEDLSLAKLAEAHLDAVAILADAGRSPQPGAAYGVWASENPNHRLNLERREGTFTLSGVKTFCSGIGYVDCALVTVGEQLLEIDLREHIESHRADLSQWSTEAFRATNTGTIHFERYPTSANAMICGPGWYTKRPGFWHGACGVAACWAGGAEGLVHFGKHSPRNDPHTLAHLGAMSSSIWGMKAIFSQAAKEIDRDANNYMAAKIRALELRHLIEQHCTDILKRLPRAYGPYPLALHSATANRYHELDLYLRQSHAERDLEVIGQERNL